jgi:hypothetical protein
LDCKDRERGALQQDVRLKILEKVLRKHHLP